MREPIRIPTVVGLILTVIVVGAVIFFTEQVFRMPSRASPSQTPTNVHTTNVSDTSFTVSWLTDSPTTGTLLVSATNKKNQIYFDERDTTGKLGTYVTHSVTVRDAQPNTNYTFKILSNGSQFLDNNKDFTLQTPTALSPNTNGLGPAYGTVVIPSGIPVEGALLYLTIDGGQELSALTKSSGLWLIPLNQTRTTDLRNYLPVVDRMGETITVQYSNLESTAITDTLNDSPVPEILLGKTYDFRHLQANALPTTPPVLAQNPTSLGSVLGQSTTKTYTISLTQPREGAALTTTLPLIAGTGIPDRYVGISLSIVNPISGSAKVDPSGLWSYTPTRRLSSGKQSVTILTTDANGKPVAITHTFEILKSGTQVLGVATPSATLTPTETPVTSPTGEETPVPTSTLSGETPPTTGYELPTILLLIIGLGLFVGGAVAVAQ